MILDTIILIENKKVENDTKIINYSSNKKGSWCNL